MNIYSGERSATGRIRVRVNGRPLNPRSSQDPNNGAEDGFGWGFAGHGPAQLALAILLDVTGDSDADEFDQRDFQRQFVAQWGDRWQITDVQVREWLETSRTLHG
ncbi:DUF6166 domain-containing protein [Frigoriglobus tundricola]|uniref:Uncharacterized protein n=1 Tax=Frigoriglobus tundricola TaxID=2774151 RepID=A0A6M5Z3F4_9BACT|nr:DUF6166 domain-containing protein [Frigoriglobus tundricola]QJX00245.1 hypothetical protein FTUN_7869 [Frigoriglobus tundricola]